MKPVQQINVYRHAGRVAVSLFGEDEAKTVYINPVDASRLSRALAEYENDIWLYPQDSESRLGIIQIGSKKK